MSRAHVATSDCSPPPSTNRGAAMTEGEQGGPLAFGVHWLAATVQADSGLDVRTVLGFISEELRGADWTSTDRGVSGYTKTYKTLFGLRIYINDSRPEMGIHMIADGDCCEALGIGHLKRIFLGLQMRATRIDLAIDRYQDGKMVEHWAVMDNRGLVQQLGPTPAPL
jgi:predicted ester cyclase